MNLLLSRGQAQGATGRPVFNLWAKAELLPEEEALLAKYRDVRNAVLLDGDATRALKLAAYIALPLAAAVALFVLANVSAGTAAVTFLFAFGLAAYLIYEQLREQVYIRDLLNGRAFKCRSVTELMEKEEIIKGMAVNFRQLLEDMKDWGGKEVVAIAPLRTRPTAEVVTLEVEPVREQLLSAAE